MNRFAIFLLFVAFGLGSQTLLVGQQKLNRPNIILVMADDMGWGDTSHNGHEILKTPHLDEMANNGISFQRFYAAAPVCSPTRGSCLTGRHPFRYGIFHANTGHLPTAEVTVAEYLSGLGYATGHFGKWHLGTLTKSVRDSNRGGPKNVQHYSPPNLHGFDTFYSTEAKVPTYDPRLKPQKAKKTFWLPLNPNQKGVDYGTRYWTNEGEVTTPLKGDDSQIIMDQAVKFIERNRSKPFFSVVWFHAPHLPVVASDFDRADFKELDEYSQSYFGCLKALDRQMGRLRKTLMDMNLSENTMLCFCSDNGPEGKPTAPGSAKLLRGRKRSLYEGGVRVPGFIEWPGKIKAGSRTEFPAVTSDYFPTIVEITGGKLPDSRIMDGVSLLSVVTQKQTQQREQPIFFESAKQATVVHHLHKLVCRLDKNRGKITGSELYDLQSDPKEARDIKKEKSVLAEKMQDLLKQWRISCRKSLKGGDYSVAE